MTRDLQNHTIRGIIPDMILNDLGYCCLQRFFLLYPSPTQIAIRLGVTKRAVCKVKAKVRENPAPCEKCQKREST